MAWVWKCTRMPWVVKKKNRKDEFGDITRRKKKKGEGKHKIIGLKRRLINKLFLISTSPSKNDILFSLFLQPHYYSLLPATTTTFAPPACSTLAAPALPLPPYPLSSSHPPFPCYRYHPARSLQPQLDLVGAARAWITLGKHCLATIYWVTGGSGRAGVGQSPRLFAGRHAEAQQEAARRSTLFKGLVLLFPWILHVTCYIRYGKTDLCRDSLAVGNIYVFICMVWCLDICEVVFVSLQHTRYML